MTFGERLKIVRGDMNQGRFADRLGFHINTIGKWERDLQHPNIIDINHILSNFPEINPTWLLTGEGDMKRGLAGAEHLDESLLASVIGAVEEYLDDVKGHLPPTKKAQLVVALYDLFVDDEEKKVEKATVIRLVKLAA